MRLSMSGFTQTAGIGGNGVGTIGFPGALGMPGMPDIGFPGFPDTGYEYYGNENPGLGFVSTGNGFDWGELVGDLAKGWTNIGAQILVPPTYVQNAGGVEIRGGAPVLQTGVQPGGGAYGAVPGGGYAGAGLTTGGLTAGISNTSMLMIGTALLAVVVLARR